MDPADPVRAAFAKQAAATGSHKQELQALGAQCKAISETQSGILTSIQPAVPSAPPPTTTILQTELKLYSLIRGSSHGQCAITQNNKLNFTIITLTAEKGSLEI